MQFPNDNSNGACSRINKYLDGEMLSSDLSAFEAHAAKCESCGLEIELHREIEKVADEIVLPKDFSKVVAATAESQVSGLRRKTERRTTLAIIAGLALAVFLVVGVNIGPTVSVLAFALDKAGAFFAVIGTFLLNLALGIVIVLKVAATQMHLSDSGVFVIFAVCAGVLLAYFLFSGRVARLRDVKR